MGGGLWVLVIRHDWVAISAFPGPALKRRPWAGIGNRFAVISEHGYTLTQLHKRMVSYVAVPNADLPFTSRVLD